jgi:hypothetical protein
MDEAGKVAGWGIGRNAPTGCAGLRRVTIGDIRLSTGADTTMS